MKIATWLFPALFAFGCLSPVPSSRDGGSGTDGSVDAGPSCYLDRDCPPSTAGCTYPRCVLGHCSYYVSGICDGGVATCTFGTDCKGSGPSVPWCAQPDAGAAFSCVNGACVWECPGGRTCTADLDAGCLSCVIPPGATCEPDSGPDAGSCDIPSGVGTVESSTCANPVVAPPIPFTGTALVFQPRAICRSDVTIQNDGPLGSVVALSSGAFIADFPPLGGACTGELLPTNVLRLLWNCPRCQFVVSF